MIVTINFIIYYNYFLYLLVIISVIIIILNHHYDFSLTIISNHFLLPLLFIVFICNSVHDYNYY